MAGSTRDERRGARDGSDRVARIARWLATPVRNSAVDRLALTLEDGDVLGSWDVADVRGAEDALAYRIDALLIDAANDALTTINARLAWMAGETAWLSKAFRARCDAAELEHVKPLDGSNLSWLQQSQRHTEALASQIATITNRSEERIERVLSIYERMMSAVLTRLQDAEQRLSDAEHNEAAALQLAETAQASAEQAQAEAEQVANAGNDTMGRVIEIATKQLLAGTQAAK